MSDCMIPWCEVSQVDTAHWDARERGHHAERERLRAAWYERNRHTWEAIASKGWHDLHEVAEACGWSGRPSTLAINLQIAVERKIVSAIQRGRDLTKLYRFDP